MPGPASYDTRQVSFTTGGGGGSHTGQKWSFGTEAREIDRDVISRASGIPACTDYDPVTKGGDKKKIKISFG